MFKFIKKWQENKKIEDFENGYSYASVLLLKSNGANSGYLETASSCPFWCDDFDSGIVQALIDWEKQFTRLNQYRESNEKLEEINHDLSVFSEKQRNALESLKTICHNQHTILDDYGNRVGEDWRVRYDQILIK